MTANAIEHATLELRFAAGAVSGVSIVNQSGGWGVVIQQGMLERALAAKRGAVKNFRKSETLVGYPRNLGIL